MSNLWINDLKNENEYKEFIDLYDLAIARKTSNIHRLSMKLGRIWDGLNLKKRKEYTDRLIESGRVDGKMVKAIKMFNGSIFEIHKMV